jgi:hypothetical protein
MTSTSDLKKYCQDPGDVNLTFLGLVSLIASKDRPWLELAAKPYNTEVIFTSCSFKSPLSNMLCMGEDKERRVRTFVRHT